MRLSSFKNAIHKMQPNSLLTLPTVVAATLVAVTLSTGCTKKAPDRLDEEAHSLYERSVKFMRTYTDSMNRAKDSTTWARLSNNYDDLLGRLNFEFPADTDLHLTEGENDTLSMLNTAFVRAREKAEERIFHPKAPTDSVPADSVPIR